MGVTTMGVNHRALQLLSPRADTIPWALLATTGISQAALAAQLDAGGLLRVALLADEPVAAYVLSQTSPTAFVLHALAVPAARQGQGIGRWMLGHAIGVTESKGGRTLEVCLGAAQVQFADFFLRQRFVPVPGNANGMRLQLALIQE